MEAQKDNSYGAHVFSLDKPIVGMSIENPKGLNCCQLCVCALVWGSREINVGLSCPHCCSLWILQTVWIVKLRIQMQMCGGSKN